MRVSIELAVVVALGAREPNAQTKMLGLTHDGVHAGRTGFQVGIQLAKHASVLLGFECLLKGCFLRVS